MYIQVLGIAIPIAIQHLMISFNSLIDNFMVGALGSTSIAATGSASRFISIVRLTIFGIVAGNAILTAQYSAKNDKRGIAHSLILSIVGSLIVSTLFLIIYFLNRDRVLFSFSSDLGIQRLIREYLDVAIFSPFILSFLYSIVLSLRSRGVINFQFLSSAMLVITNCTLNFLLIFGRFGFPKLGIKGAALATLISEIVVTLIVFFGDYIFGYKTIERVEYLFNIKVEFIIKYLKLSLPIILTNFLWSFSLMLLHTLFGTFGGKVLAAYGAFTPIEMLISHLFAGFGSALLVIVGRELGSDNFDAAYKKAKKISIMALVIASIVGVVVSFNAYSIASLYGFEPLILKYISKMINIFGIFLIFRIFNSISFNGIFRSGGDTLFIFWVGVISSWVLMIPISYLGQIFFDWSWVTIYLVINLVEVVISILFAVRFISGRWMKNIIRK